VAEGDPSVAVEDVDPECRCKDHEVGLIDRRGVGEYHEADNDDAMANVREFNRGCSTI
jgi:hypothetical protein